VEAVIFTGVPGSGKTSFYRSRFFDTHVRISLDMLKTRRREELLLAACLKAGQRFVVDNTNPLITDRARYTRRSRDAGFKILAYFFRSPLSDAVRRNAQRKLKQKVPVAALSGIFKKLQPPTLDEGFDQIYVVEITADNDFAVSPNGATERLRSDISIG
jgi:predicted kinase